MWQRLKPALALILLAPLIAEYLLGSLSFNQLTLFPIMALMYGAGALFVREATRRSGRGWPTIITLGVAYGIVEEGLATQSLFNPHYLGLRLLDYGFIPALGVGGPWTAYVVLLHVVWSIAVPIALVESIFPAPRSAPWLGKTGLVVTGVSYALGVVLVGFGTWTKERFMASGRELSVTAIAAAAALALAFVVSKPGRAAPAHGRGSPPWRPVRFGALAFVAGSTFHLVNQLGSGLLSPSVVVGIDLLLPAVVLGLVWAAEKSGAWTEGHTDALMLGGLLAYCWLGFFLTVRLHGVGTIPGQFFPVTIVLVLVYRRFVRPRSAGKAGQVVFAKPVGWDR